MRTSIIMATISLTLATAVVVGASGSENYPEPVYQYNNDVYFVQHDLWEPYGFQKALILHAPLVAQGPTIDGLANDPIWAKAASLKVPLAYGTVREATIKAVYTTEEVFLLVSWPDSTMDNQHHPWLWSESVGRYVEGPQIEDSLMVSLEGGCDWSPSLLAGYVYDFDAWLWLAARTNPVGQAVDADGSVQNRMVPGLGFVKYRARATEPFWNLKFVDFRKRILTTPWYKLKRMYKRAPIAKDVFVRYQADGSPPPAFAQRLKPPDSAETTSAYSKWGVRFVQTTPQVPQMAPQYQPVKLTGDAGEVAAKGRWIDGRWTVEFRRSMVTLARTSTDSIFQRATQFSIHVFDHTERADEASESGRIILQFDPVGAAKGK